MTSATSPSGIRDPALKLNNVAFRRQRRIILTDVNLEIGRGEKWILFGPNGIGKSTLVQMMSTRGFPSEGTVDILGNRLGKVDVFSYRHKIGLSSAELSRAFPPQEDPVDTIVTALTATTGRWHDTYSTQDYDRARALMAQFGITYLEGKQMFRLSEGERTRVLICRALMADPELLILDEPTTGLDLGGRELVLQALSAIGRQDHDRSVVLVTHRLEEIPQGFQHIAIMGHHDEEKPQTDSNDSNDSNPRPGTIIYQGSLEEGLTTERLTRTFNLPLQVAHIHGRWSAFANDGDEEPRAQTTGQRQTTQPARGVLRAAQKVQFMDRKGAYITDLLLADGSTHTEHGLILHDDVIGKPQGCIVTTVRGRTQSQHDQEDLTKPWKASRAIGGWQYAVFRPRLADYVLSMPRAAQIMYPKDIAQVLQLGDIRRGMRVLESGAGSGALSINLLDAIGPSGSLTTVEMRPEFAKVAQANATLYFGAMPQWWTVVSADFDHAAPGLPKAGFDRVVLDMLDPWNRLEHVFRLLVPGGVLTVYVTTTTQLSRLSQTLEDAGVWTQPDIVETLERGWQARGLAVRPEHQMIGHTGFLLTTRTMAPGNTALSRRGRAGKDVVVDVDSMSSEQKSKQLDDLILRDLSDRKLRRVLRDLDRQVEEVTEG